MAWVVEDVPGWEVVLEVGLVDGLVGVVLEVTGGSVVPRSSGLLPSGVESPPGCEQPSVKE